MCIRKFFDDFIKDNPTLENNDLVVRKDNKKYIVKINKDGMFDYKEVEEKENNLQLVISTMPYRKKEYLCVYNKECDIIEKELKALEIIKNLIKFGDDLISILDFDTYEEYCKHSCDYNYELTEEEFNLLKEVFCNE